MDLRAARLLLLIPSLLFAAAASAADWPISTVTNLGVAPSVGIGAKQFGTGFTYSLDAAWHPERTTAWMLRGGHTDLSRDRSPESAIAAFNNDQLYVPVVPGANSAVDVDFLQLGIRRSHRLGGVRPFLEAGVGASLVRDDPTLLTGALSNDRRQAWDAPPPTAGERRTEVAPSFGIGLGAAMTLPGGVALATSIGADFTATHGLAGAQLPVRFGASWPAAPLPAMSPAEPGAARLRVAAGWSALHTPQRIEGGLAKGHSYSAEVELPVAERLSVSLAGEHDLREARETYYRTQITNVGTVEYVPAGNVEASFAATVATLGLRAQQPVGRVAFSLRSGIGFGRTSGFGATVQTVHGAYIDSNGQWTPVLELARVGAGAAETGWAFAVAAGADVRVAGAARVFAESGLTSIELDGDHVRMTPLRIGVALR